MESNNPFVRFIIPSVGRSNLSRALQCIQNQTLSNWTATVAFDGPQHNIPKGFENDKRITFIHAPPQKSAGFTRNYAMRHLQEPWVAFLDDDDKIRPDYIEKLKYEISLFPQVLTVIWRINYHNDIVPDAESKDFRIGRVGIAFAINYQIFKYYGLAFKNEYAEDFKLLNEIRNRKLPMVISPYVVYSIRDVDFNFKRHHYEEIDENRARINEDVSLTYL